MTEDSRVIRKINRVDKSRSLKKKKKRHSHEETD